MRDKLRRELLKDQSDWNLLEKLRFVGQHKVNSSRNNERQLQQAVTTSALINVSWRALSSDQLIAQDEDDALQEAMDEQHVASTVLVPPPPPLPTPLAGGSGTTASNEDLMKRIEALLQGLGTNRSRAEKRLWPICANARCVPSTMSKSMIYLFN